MIGERLDVNIGLGEPRAGRVFCKQKSGWRREDGRFVVSECACDVGFLVRLGGGE
jgi:hypothetical protein